MRPFDNRPLSVFRPDSAEYRRLLLVRDCLNACARTPHAHVEDTWYDRGQKWRYTTVIVRKPADPCGMQVLSPRQQGLVLYGSLSDLADILKELAGKPWLDQKHAEKG